jgi:hypothetical protein
MMFLDCPAYLDHDGAVRCGLPAEVRCRFTMRSTDGPVESAMIRCPAGHYFCGAIESLTWDGTDKHDPGSAAVTSRARRDNLQRGHDSRHGGGGSALRDVPAEPEPGFSRPNTAPAYYLGHPARLWITVMRRAAGVVGAEREVWQGAGLGCGVTRTSPIRGIRDLGIICPPAAQPSPMASTRAPGDLDD